VGSRGDRYEEGCEQMKKLQALVIERIPESWQALRAKVSGTLGPRALTIVTIRLRVPAYKAYMRHVALVGASSCCLLLSAATVHCC
jgi:hypothetical protein